MARDKNFESLEKRENAKTTAVLIGIVVVLAGGVLLMVSGLSG